MPPTISRTLQHARQDMTAALIIFTILTLFLVGLEMIGAPTNALYLFGLAYLVPAKLTADAWRMRNDAIAANAASLAPAPPSSPRYAVNTKEKGKWDAFVDWANQYPTAKETCMERYGIGQDTWNQWREEAVALGLGVWVEAGGGYALRWIASLNDTLAMRDEALRRMEEGRYA